jgi:hypothetical protein
LLQVLEAGEPSAPIVVTALTALLRSDLLLQSDVDAALAAFAAADLIPEALLARARWHADRLATA